LGHGAAWGGALDLVFPNRVGKPLDANNLLNYHFQPPVKRAGLPPMRFPICVTPPRRCCWGAG
jgi:hypothetical protein